MASADESDGWDATDSNPTLEIGCMIREWRGGQEPRLCWHEVSVSDNGEGFDPAYAERIFEPFRRLHGVTVPGSGIGLATCKRIIERLGGTIWAESVVGEGSIFHFRLPAAD